MKAVLGVAVATAALWTTASVQAERQVIGPVQECEVTAGVETVPVQAEPVQIPLRHSEAVGDSVTAAFPAESGIGVVSIGRDEGDEPMTLRLVANTSEAAAGVWELTIRGTEAECKGTITVAAPDTAGR